VQQLRRLGESHGEPPRHQAVAKFCFGKSMEQKRLHDDRLDIARHLYDALCGQYPDQFIILCDAQGRILARHDAPTVSTAAAAAFLVRDNPRLN